MYCKMWTFDSPVLVGPAPGSLLTLPLGLRVTLKEEGDLCLKGQITNKVSSGMARDQHVSSACLGHCKIAYFSCKGVVSKQNYIRNL